MITADRPIFRRRANPHPLIAGGAGVGIVQQFALGEQGSGSQSCGFNSPTTPNNAILALVVLYSQDGGSSEIDMAATNPVTDGQNVYNPIAAGEVKRAAVNWYQHTYWYLAKGIAGSSTQTSGNSGLQYNLITFNFQRATYNFITLYELTPCQSDPVHPGITGQGTNGGTGTPYTIDIGSLTPSRDGALAFMEVQHDGDNAGSANNLVLGSTWTQDRFDSAGGGQDTAGHQSQTTAAAIDFNATGASGGGQVWSASGVILVPPGADISGSVSMSATATLHLAGFRTRTARAAMSAVVTATFRGVVTHAPTNQFPVHTDLRVTKQTDTALTTDKRTNTSLQTSRRLNTTLNISGSS